MSIYAGQQSRAERAGATTSDSGPAIGKQTLAERAYAPEAAVQRRANADGDGAPGQDATAVHASAARGIATSASAMPHAEAIQRSFGRHDVSSIQAHLGRDAAASADDMGADAYAIGHHVVLGKGTDLFTVAHEAAHVVQQRGGVQLKGGVGEASDAYERHADEVASLVVAGKSAEGLLDRYAGGSGGPAGGGIQRKETALKAEGKARAPAKLASSAAFEHKLGSAAYRDPRSLAAADQMIHSLTAATLPGFDAGDAADQQKLVDLYGKDQVGGAWSAGQVGKEFATVMEALGSGNLRERMTGIYNASLSGFKTEILRLMSEERWAEMSTRGLDADKLKRRKNQMKYNPGAKDLYRDPGNPLDRKKLSTFEARGQTRTKAPDAEQASQRTVGDLANAGAELSDREKRFMYPDQYTGGDLDLLFAVDPGEAVKWKEGGTYWKINPDNKWVKKCQDKLHMPVTAGPSGTALRMFQAWEFVGKPAVKEDFRLALLGWMMTSNDHSFHEIMMTSAEYGMPYTPGLDAYRQVAPFTEDELRAIAAPEGFPDEEHYRADHMTAGSQSSVFSTPAQIARFEAVIASGSDIWAAGAPPSGGELAQAMAVLVYTDDAPLVPGAGAGVAAYKFINNVLKGNDNQFVMRWFLSRDPALKAAYDANRFNIKELVSEAKQHAKYMEAGLRLLKPFTGQVYRGFRTNSLPKVGETWTEAKFSSMSQQPHVAAAFADKGVGRYHILVTMTSVTGRDMGDLSMFGAGEAEVVFPPGSVFRVTGAPQPWPGRGPEYYQVDWTNS
jgi:hypothetical protein